MADNMGNLIGWEETGLVAGKRWITAEDDKKMSAFCNTERERGYGRDWSAWAFRTWRYDTARPPNCRCTVVPVLAEDMPKFDFYCW